MEHIKIYITDQNGEMVKVVDTAELVIRDKEELK